MVESELKQFDKVWTASDVMGAGCVDKCTCDIHLGDEKDQQEIGKKNLNSVEKK